MDKNKKKHSGTAPTNQPNTPAGTNEQPENRRGDDTPTAENRK